MGEGEEERGGEGERGEGEREDHKAKGEVWGERRGRVEREGRRERRIGR